MEKIPLLRFKIFKKKWSEYKLSQKCNIYSGRDYKHLKNGNIPVYGSGGYMLSVSESLSDKDAIGIGRKGSINNPFLLRAPFWTVDTLFYVINNEQTDLLFLYQIFQKVRWKKYDESTGVPSLSKKTIEHGYYLFACYGDAVKIASKKDMSNLKSQFISEGFTVKEG